MSLFCSIAACNAGATCWEIAAFAYPIHAIPVVNWREKVEEGETQIQNGHRTFTMEFKSIPVFLRCAQFQRKSAEVQKSFIKRDFCTLAGMLEEFIL
jgi:hypothetical protein